MSSGTIGNNQIPRAKTASLVGAYFFIENYLYCLYIQGNTYRMKTSRRIVFLLSCFGAVIIHSNSFATDGGALLSVSITNGTPVVPRSMFTQTWTFTNNGTTTWTAGPNGYTLDMVGLDSLGAIPLDTNISGGTYHFPRAAINSGKSVKPGGTASYSMEFIAPEATGSYADSFQLYGTNWFGPTVTVQVAVASGGNTNVFDRSRAISYANNYAAYVCSDGYFWTNSNVPDWVYDGTNVFTPVPTMSTADDCAHFVSCCIGREPHLWGGGMYIPGRTPPTYGEPSASRIITTVLEAPGFAVEVPSISQLEPGDVVGWNWSGDTNMADIQHVTLYMGNNLLTCHAASALDVDSTYFGTGWAWHLIHILDYPTLRTSRFGTTNTFSWTTCWTNYSLYSASSLNGPWAKISTKPTITGITNSLKIKMPVTGSVYYRLELP